MDIPENLNRFLSRLLIALKIYPNRVGFEAVKRLVALSYTKKSKICELYAEVASQSDFKSTFSGVETAARQALAIAQAQDSFKLLDRLVGAPLAYDKNMKVGTFVSILVDYLKNAWDGSDNVRAALSL